MFAYFLSYTPKSKKKKLWILGQTIFRFVMENYIFVQKKCSDIYVGYHKKIEVLALYIIFETFIDISIVFLVTVCPSGKSDLINLLYGTKKLESLM